ncbi:MAG: DUF4625 domain-containing protein [Tannerella sp.]|jgi:hypothetical protein|nr:DUF4625 domain-containing protein [Tannerella sp.]
MRIFKYLFTVSFAISALSLSTSCDTESDTTPPVINLIEPENDELLHIGGEVHFEMELSDDEGLKSYKVEIHNNFNSHTHELTVRSAGEDENTTPFAFNKSWDVSGKKNASIHHLEIVIPENATPGHYHFMVYCTDEAGNESHAVREVELSHEEGEEHEH